MRVSTFSTLFRHALILSGVEAPAKKREIFREAALRFSVSASPFETLFDVREGTRKLPAASLLPYNRRGPPSATRGQLQPGRAVGVDRCVHPLASTRP